MKAELEPLARAIASACGYAYVRPVGEGAFKETYEVIEGDLRHALKVFRPRARNERIQREVDAMLRCNHPNIAKLRRVDIADVPGVGPCLYAIEEFLSGGTLTERIAREGLLSPKQAYALGDILVDAVAHIAGHDLVHRDIKLDNIMLREDGHTPVIVDFGVVRALGDQSLTKSWAPRGPGTPLFAPAEQLCNDKQLIDWRADQFSLGVSLAMTLFNRHPYREVDGESASDVVDRVAMRTAGVSADFKQRATAAGLPVLIRMVAPWPVERYRTTDALSAAWRAQREEW